VFKTFSSRCDACKKKRARPLHSSINNMTVTDRMLRPRFAVAYIIKLAAWHSGRTSVSDWQTFPVLRSTCKRVWENFYIIRLRAYGLLLQPRPSCTSRLTGCSSVTPTPQHVAHYLQIWRHPWNRKCTTYRNAGRGGPCHGHRLHAKNVVKIGRVVPEIYGRGQRVRQTRSSQYFASPTVS